MTPLVLNSGIDEVRKHSTWFLVIGIALVILGMVAIGYAFEMTIVSVIFLGWLLIIGGLFEVIHGSPAPAMERLFHQFAGRRAILRRGSGDGRKSRARSGNPDAGDRNHPDRCRAVPALRRFFDSIASSRMGHPQWRDLDPAGRHDLEIRGRSPVSG